MASEIQISQVRSSNGSSKPQLETLRSLKLGRIGRSATHQDSPQLRGMLKAVDHLIEVSEKS